MAATDEMLAIALHHKPHAACIVPEKRAELTTEGGLDAHGGENHLRRYVDEMVKAGIRVSLFIDPDESQIRSARRLGAPVVELHTGTYAEMTPGSDAWAQELERIVQGAALAEDLGLECHAGHGLSYDNVGAIAAIPNLVELNIGHFLVGEAIFGGLDSAIKRMRALMDQARAEATGSRSA
jgi:pyridoxine 5-phosphate synthase